MVASRQRWSGWRRRAACPLQPAQLLQHRLGRSGLRENAASLRQEQSSGLGQHDAAPDAVEQLYRVPLLKRCDGGRCRRLRNVQRERCGRHVLALGHADEDTELLQRHVTAIAQLIRFDDRNNNETALERSIDSA